jgi:hypothetical protein
LAPSTTTLKFRASICRSVMLINAAELNLRFDDAVVGTRCTKTFTVRNLSEMPLAYTLRLASAKETYVDPLPHAQLRTLQTLLPAVPSLPNDSKLTGTLGGRGGVVQ